MIHTDEALGYKGLPKAGFGHQAINHTEGKYSENGVTTNGIESVWAVLKRGVHGIYHHISPKHTARYVNEFTFRLNDGNVKRARTERLASLVTASFGKHLTYKRLTHVSSPSAE